MNIKIVWKVHNLLLNLHVLNTYNIIIWNNSTFKCYYLLVLIPKHGVILFIPNDNNNMLTYI